MTLEIEHLRNLAPDELLVKEGKPFIELNLTTGYVKVGITEDSFASATIVDNKITYELSHRIDASGIYDWINREMYFDFEELMTFGEEESELGKSLVRICKHYVPQLSFLAGFWTADKWLNRPESSLEEYNITAKTDHFDLIRIADRIVDEALTLYAILDVTDVQGFLTRYHEELQPVTQHIDLTALDTMPADIFLDKDQLAYLSVNIEEGVITAQFNEIFEKHTRNFHLDARVDASQLKQFCEVGLHSLLAILFEGRVKNYDGQEMGLYLTRQAENVCAEIAQACIDRVPILHENAGFWDAHVWLEKADELPNLPQTLTHDEAIEMAALLVGQARLQHAHIDEDEMAVALLEKVEVV